MSETVNQEATATVNESPVEEKRFTQADLDKVVADRLARERQKYEGFSELKEKAAKFDELEAASKTELQKATEKAEKLEQELKALKKAEEVRAIRAKVAQDENIPVNLLTGETEEECVAQAKAINAYANPDTYPALRDGGEVQNGVKGSNEQLFADFMRKALR